MSHNIDVVVSATDRASAVLNNVGNSMAGIGRQAMGFAAGTLGVNAFTDAVRQAGDALIGYNARMQQTATGLGTMLGSAEAATEYIKQMKDFAAKTPFEFQDIDQASKKLLAMGWAAKNIIPDMTAIGNAVAGLSLDKGGMDRVILALGQMQIKAKLSGEEIRQLNEAGISAQQYLAKAFNLTADAFDDLSKTGINGAQAVRAIIDGMANDPKFKDMMSKQSQQMIGVWSTLKDNAREIFGAIGENAFYSTQGVTAYFADMTSRVVKVLRQDGLIAAMQEAFGKEWAGRISTLGDNMKDLATVAADLGRIMVKAFEPIAGMIVDAANAIMNSLIPAVKEALGAFGGNGKSSPLFLAGGIFGQLQDEWNKSPMKKALDAEAAARGRLTFDQKQMYAQSAKVGGQFEDAASRMLQSRQDKGKMDLENHKGNDPIDPGVNKKALELEKLIAGVNDKIRTMFEKMNGKIIAEVDGTYAAGMNAVKTEIAQMQRDIDQEVLRLAKEGVSVDTSSLRTKMEEYGRVMTEPVKRAWREAWADVKNQTALAIAQITGNKAAAAETEFQIQKAAIDKEFEERKRAIMVDKNDQEALEAAQNWRKNAIELADAQRRQKIRQAKLDDFDFDIQANQDLVDLHFKSQGEIDKLNRDLLLKKLDYLQKELEAEGKNADEIKKIRRQITQAQGAVTTIDENNDPKKAFGAGIRSAYNDFGTWAKNMKDLANTTAVAMRDAFSEFFFDAMTGKLKSLGDYVSSFLKSIAKAIAQMLANAMARRLIQMAFPGFIPQATGGPRRFGEMYLVGEKGPEIIDTKNGMTYNAEQANNQLDLGSGAVAPIVNIYNNTGAQTEVKQEAKFDGKRYIVNVWLEAFKNNTGGIRTVVQGAK